MSINVHENIIKAVRYYISKGLTLEGACGLAETSLGNLSIKESVLFQQG